MKRYVLIVALFFFTGLAASSQDETAPNRGGGRLQERMREYIQNRLNLSRNEAERFSPIFLRYIGELRRTHRDNIADKPMLQLKIAELRVRFRNEFRQVVDENRANKVYEYQREFEDKVRGELLNRRGENRPNRRFR